LPPSPSACRLAPGARSSPAEPFCTAEWLNEEPDMGKPFVRFCEGLGRNWCMDEIVWHRRETRRQTENTNVMPGALEGLILLDKYCATSRCLTVIVAEQSTKALSPHHVTCLTTNYFLPRDQLIVETLMIALSMIVSEVVVDRIIEYTFTQH